MAIDIASLAMAGLAYLLMKGGKGDKVKRGEVAPTPSKAPWPSDKGTPEHPYSETHPASRPHYSASIPASEAHAPVYQTNPDMPMMQKGIPGVHQAAQHAVDVLRAQQDANEFGKGSGTGTRHYRPSKHVTPQQRERAQYLTKDPEWRNGREIRDADDPSVLYVQKRHYSKAGKPLKAVEVWTSDY